MKFRDKSIFDRQSTDDLMFYVKRKIDLLEWKVVFAIENWEFVVCSRDILEDRTLKSH